MHKYIERYYSIPMSSSHDVLKSFNRLGISLRKRFNALSKNASITNYRERYSSLEFEESSVVSERKSEKSTRSQIYAPVTKNSQCL